MNIRCILPQSKCISLTLFIAAVFACLLLFSSCEAPTSATAEQASTSGTYLNHSDSARYVGMNSCRQCHQEIYNTFIRTGMGRSFGRAKKERSSGEFSDAGIYDTFSDFHYKAFWQHDSLFINEFRVKDRDTLFSRSEQVNYIIGSGQHTNSHLQAVNGYVNQMPMTYYTQKKRWDLPPGFENGVNTRYSRKIGLECMTCHNAFPQMVKGSENKYIRVPEGIDCERCHGPGSIHVAQRSTGSKVDTSKYIDYSIVNPAKLSVDAQFDICQRCHLQGNAIVKEGKTFLDFKPGQTLSDYISVFMPRYENADDEFIMASHSQRLKQSACFIKSSQTIAQAQTLRPFKNALTCVTCHNPHVSVKETNTNVFNEACQRCHKNSTNDSSREAALNAANCGLFSKTQSNCVSCHMPASGSTDIPHVSVHDHYIRKPLIASEKKKIKLFLGLYSVNEPLPDTLTRARAYIDHFEKFDQKKEYLDSAQKLLSGKSGNERFRYAIIQLHFIQQQYKEIRALVSQLGETRCFEHLFVKSSYDNCDAWAAYRIAESYLASGENVAAKKWFARSVFLAPYYPEFRNKLGTTLVSLNDMAGAAKQFEIVLKESPRFVSTYSNLGYLKMLQGLPSEAFQLYNKGEKLDPDNEALLLNLSAYYLSLKNFPRAATYLKRVLTINPGNVRAKEILKQLGT